MSHNLRIDVDKLWEDILNYPQDTTDDLARRHNCSGRHICYLIKENELPYIRKPSKRKEIVSINELQAYFRANPDAKQVDAAKRFKCSKGTISRMIRKYNVLGAPKQRRKRRKLDIAEHRQLYLNKAEESARRYRRCETTDIKTPKKHSITQSPAKSPRTVKSKFVRRTIDVEKLRIDVEVIYPEFTYRDLAELHGVTHRAIRVAVKRENIDYIPKRIVKPKTVPPQR
jgi:hypothetical protein